MAEPELDATAARVDSKDSSGRLLPRVALVTGCGKKTGMGWAIALVLAERGIRVVVTDVDWGGAANRHEVGHESATEADLHTLVAEITDLGGQAYPTLGDVSSVEDVERIIRETDGRFGRLDIVVNNAAAPRMSEFGDISAVDPSEWDRVMTINARGPFLVCRAAIPLMRKNHWGRIIMISSLAGRVGMPRQAIYSASKHAVVGLARSLAMDLAADGITVNSICPGFTLTSRAMDGARRRSATDDIGPELDNMAAKVPVGRLGAPMDIANAVAFLASDASGYVTGQTLGVDGGLHPA